MAAALLGLALAVPADAAGRPSSAAKPPATSSAPPAATAPAKPAPSAPAPAPTAPAAPAAKPAPTVSVTGSISATGSASSGPAASGGTTGSAPAAKPVAIAPKSSGTGTASATTGSHGPSASASATILAPSSSGKSSTTPSTTAKATPGTSAPETGTAGKKSTGKKAAKSVASAAPEETPAAPPKKSRKTSARGDETPHAGSADAVPAAAAVAPDDTASTTSTAKSKDKSKSKKKTKVAAAETAPAEEPAPKTKSSGFSFWGSPSEATLELGSGVPTLSPENVGPMKAAIARYESIVAKGGWPSVPMVQMGPGMSSDSVAILRRRLEIEGDVAPGGGGFFGESTFESSIEEGVRRFQIRNGLTPTGDLLDKDRSKNGTRTLTALNVPASSRLQQLKANLQRMQSQARTAGKRYVLVNLPGQQIEAVNDGRVELRLLGVVGKPDRPSPILSSVIHQVKFNPVWTLPPTVIKEDLIPKGREMQRKKQNVLVKFGIDAYDGSGRKLDPSKINWASEAVYGYRYSQQPSKDNPLGFVKIDFASPQSVYMHDTPSQKLFQKEYRAASSGCIRIEHAEKLAAWLLRDNGDWSLSRVLSMKETGEQDDVPLKKGVPLYWVYITAWATEDGVVHFRRDLYGKDIAMGVHKLAAAY